MPSTHVTLCVGGNFILYPTLRQDAFLCRSHVFAALWARYSIILVTLENTRRNVTLMSKYASGCCKGTKHLCKPLRSRLLDALKCLPVSGTCSWDLDKYRLSCTWFPAELYIRVKWRKQTFQSKWKRAFLTPHQQNMTRKKLFYSIQNCSRKNCSVVQRKSYTSSYKLISVEF